MKKEHIILFQQMGNWTNYLEINDRYKDNSAKQKCILFILLWMQYNEYYNIRYESIKRDSEKAIKIAEDTEYIMVYEHLKDKFLENFKNIKGADSPRTWIYSYNCCRTNKVYYTDNKSSMQDFLKIIYKIRCNLFHGDKPPEEANVEIIGWAYDCLSKLLERTQIIKKTSD